MNKIYTIVGLVLFCCSCSPELPDRDELITSMYNEKVKRLKAEKNEICKKNLLEKAIMDVDSLVHQLINRDLMDTLDFPGRPHKPNTPDHIIGTVQKFDFEGK